MEATNQPIQIQIDVSPIYLNDENRKHFFTNFIKLYRDQTPGNIVLEFYYINPGEIDSKTKGKNINEIEQPLKIEGQCLGKFIIPTQTALSLKEMITNAYGINIQ